MVVCSGFYIIYIGGREQIENPKKYQIFVSDYLSSYKQGTYEMKKIFAAKF